MSLSSSSSSASSCLLLCLPFCLCLVFSLVLPLETPDLTLEVLLVNHTWNLPQCLNATSSAARSSSTEGVALMIPVIGFFQRRSRDLHEVTFSSNEQTFATLFSFSGKQLTLLLALLVTSFYPPASLHHSPLFFWLLSLHKQRRFTAKWVKGVWSFSVANEPLSSSFSQRSVRTLFVWIRHGRLS